MFDREIAAAIAKWGPYYHVTIPVPAVKAIIEHESSNGAHDTTAESGGRYSYGPMMVLDTTARGYGVADPSTLKDPALGIYYGVRYFAYLLQLFKGDVVHAIASYNGGVKRADGSYTNPAYVSTVVGIWKRLEQAALPVGVILLFLVGGFLFLRGRRAARAA